MVSGHLNSVMEVFFHGNWKNGKRHGQGTLMHSDGRVDEGIWENGKFISVSYNNMFNMFLNTE